MKQYESGPVHIRTKKISNGRLSLILDTYKDGQRVKESLGLYLVPENTRGDKLVNKAVMLLVEWLEEQRKFYKAHGNNNYSAPPRHKIANMTR